MKEDALDTVQKCLQATKDFVLKRLDDADAGDDRVDEQGAAFVSCEEARAYYAGCIEALCRAQGVESVDREEAGAASRELLRFIIEEKRLPIASFVTNNSEGRRSRIIRKVYAEDGKV